MLPDILKDYPSLLSWVKKCVDLLEPSSVSIFLDPVLDDKKFTDQLLQKGVLRPLKWPYCFHVSTDPEDTARVEECTYICTSSKHMAGPTNNWKDPLEMKQHLESLFKGCMKGREMIIIPYCMGPLDSPYKVIGIEITDSPYVAISMRRMARTGLEVLKLLKTNPFVPGLHSVGYPLKDGQTDKSWPCDPQKRIIAHFPETSEIFSYGSGYGGNALLGKKCLSLRIASYMGYKQGFLAEHMLIMGVESPSGEKKYFAAAFPSSCGKTNLAMLESKMPGWKISVVGDDIAWIHIDDDGFWRAINPEFGFFGVAPGTSMASNPTAMRMIMKDTLFTNTGYTESGEVYWEGMGDPPKGLKTWKHELYDGKEKAAHPNSRFTVPITNCDRLDPLYLNPHGVKLEAILFGGRRQEAIALVVESLDYAHGVFMGASLSSETTAASKGSVGVVRQDPFAMLPFCGYNMGLYFKHWLDMGKHSKTPKIFCVNWFRKNALGEYVWPGFSENLRVLKWIFEQCDQRHSGQKLPMGFIPLKNELDLAGLSCSYEELFSISEDVLIKEKARLIEFFKTFGEDFPKELWAFV
jgi:phosphoenolpyruvate carboxykinase (GTP)